MNEGLRSWREVKILLKRRFDILVDEDLLFDENDKEKLFQVLQAKLGKTKEELQRIFAEIQLS